MSSATPHTGSVFASPTFMAAMCYAIWGLVPLFYLPIHSFGAGAIEIIAHRSLWAAICAGVLVLANRQWPEVMAVAASPRLRWMLLLTSILVATNWGVYVWAVTNGHTVEASLGYYLTPLLNMAAGALIFRERLDNWGKGAIALAVIGVLVQVIALGQVPWVALTLAGTFGTYGILRKHLQVSALAGLFVECAFLLAPAVIYLGWFESTGQGHFLHPWNAHSYNALWLVLTGPVTVLPLVLFAYAARRIALSTMGFVQFIGPTLTFFIGIGEGEAFNLARGVSFAFIWGGAIVFAFGAWRRLRAIKPAVV